MRWKHFLATAIVSLGLLGCGDDSNDEGARPNVDEVGDTTADRLSDEDELDPDAPDLGRVVALSEEFLLADIVALGIDPAASSATVEEAGFQGIDAAEVADVDVLGMTTLNLEELAALRPDTIVLLQFWADQIGLEILEALGEVVIVPDGLAPRDQITELGELLGRPEHAAAVVERLDAAVSAADEAVADDCVLSLAAVYPGPSVAIFVDGPWQIPQALLDVGCSLVPDATGLEPDSNGRVYVAEEQYGLLDADRLMLLQAPTVEGDEAALAAVGDSAIWQRLPAVQADQVITLDRLGYPGAVGQIRLVDELATRLVED